MTLLLKEWKAAGLLTMPVVMLSGHATIETAVEATRIGAFDFLEKPIGLQKLLSTVQRARAQGGTGKRASAPSISLILAKARLSTSCVRAWKRWSTSDALALLTGEVGVGSLRCARALHREPNTPWLVLEEWPAPDQQPAGNSRERPRRHALLPEVAHLSRSEQRSLAFMLGKTGAYGVRIVCASSEPLGQFRAKAASIPTLFALLSSCTVVIPPLRSRAAVISRVDRRCALAFLPMRRRDCRQCGNCWNRRPGPAISSSCKACCRACCCRTTTTSPSITCRPFWAICVIRSARGTPALPPEFSTAAAGSAEAFERIYLKTCSAAVVAT